MECEIAKVYSAVERVARKQHKCCECGVPINKGETYLVCSGIWSFGAESHKQHLICAEACEWIRDASDGECIPFGYLLEWWGDNKWQITKEAEALRIMRRKMAKVLARRRLHDRT